jgi:hypothetical protein
VMRRRKRSLLPFPAMRMNRKKSKIPRPFDNCTAALANYALPAPLNAIHAGHSASSLFAIPAACPTSSRYGPFILSGSCCVPWNHCLLSTPPGSHLVNADVFIT